MGSILNVKKENTKLIIGAICLAQVLLLFLPFIKIFVSADYYVDIYTEEFSYIGFQLISEATFWGILLLLIPVIIFGVDFIGQLSKIKPLVRTGAAILHLFCIVFASTSITAVNQAGSSSMVEVDASRRIGFWLLLLVSLLQIGFNALILLKEKNILPENIEANEVKESTQSHSNSVEDVISKLSNSFAGKKNNSDDSMEQLKKLNELKETGVITEEDYNSKKSDLLSRM